MSMIDDFVEYSAGPSRPGVNQAARTLQGQQETSFSDVDYEGYEVDEDDIADENQGMIQALETGFIPSSRLQSSLPPLFALSLVQFRNPPSHILTLVTANNLLFIASYPLSIMLVDLNKPLDIVTIDLPKPATEKGKDASQREPPVIAELFVDPTARHLIATTNSGDAFYLPISPGNPAVQSRRPRPLRIKQVITAVAWSPLSGPAGPGDAAGGSKQDVVTPPATDVLIGTASGQVLSLPLPPQDDIFKSVSISMSKPTERDLQTVYTLMDQAPVMGIAFGFWPEGDKPRKRAWVVITTKDRVYEVQGPVSNASPGKGAAWAEEVFKPVRDSAPKFQELPGDPPFPDLRLYLPTVEGQSPTSLPAPSQLAWITGPGLYASSLSTTPTSEILQHPTLIPYPPSSSTPAFARSSAQANTADSIPISITITEWHYLLLYVDRVVGISREDEKVVWQESLPLTGNEQPVCLSSDPVSRTFWVCTTHNVLEVLIRDEDRDVWRGKLERAEYADALRFAKTRPQKDVVLSRQADALFEEGRFIQAAQAYAKSSRSFGYVTLRFIDADERDALRIYLSDRLDLLDRKDRTQRMMLATWLVEIYLSKCNTLEDIVAAESATSDVDTLSIERQMMEEDMRNFITTYQHDLEPKVVYELIQSHGRTDLYLFYAKLNRDHGKVVEHWVTEERWVKAIDVLNKQESLEPYYRFATILMRNAPKETVDSWLRRTSLSPRRLVPALLQHSAPSERENHPSTRQHAIRYLQTVISSQSCVDPIIHNLLLTLYATAAAGSAEDEAALLQFLSSAPVNACAAGDSGADQPYFDLDYALRLCKANGKTQACVHIYSKLGLYEDSVDLALTKGDLELAKINADRPDGNDELRKKLWLKVAKYVVQEKNDIQSAMAFLESTDLLKIEDILPFFPDFVVIDDFKTEICSALESYAAKIDELKREMDEATASAENIKRDIAALSDRFVAVEQGDRCWKCGLALLSRQFYAFSCQHVFHVECLITMVTEFLPGPQLRRLLHLQNELVKQDGPRLLLSQNYPSSGTSTPLGPSSQRRREQQTSGNTATDLLLGVSGRNKLLAAGDRLREMIIPDALAQAVTAVGSTVASGVPLPAISLGLGGQTGKKGKKDGFKDKNEEKRLEGLTRELDDLVAAVCPLCEGSVLGLDKGFVREDEDVTDWEV